MMSSTDSSGERVAVRSSDDAVEAVAFLARSEHRVRVLELLSDGSRTRDELKMGTSVTRVTLSRILRDLEERGWVRRNHETSEYCLTAYGKLVYEDFSQLLGTMSVGQSYPDLVERLPTEWFDFNIGVLAEGERVVSENADPMAAPRAVANAVRRASSVRALVGSFTSLPMHAHAEATRQGTDPDAKVVYDSEAAAVALDNPDIRTRWQNIESEHGEAIYYSVEERFPCNVDLIDDEVYLSVGDEHGRTFDVIRCGHPTVVTWARELFERKRTHATPLRKRVTADDA
ncbi:helix-turn-helix transcriptional regulator [Halogeometricum borinquense]|uniref:helix-turn-helix transcriptional regulator n=1 Tax=Halogeometricum borinquense TaxID=60847 RepID=UPI003444D27E